MKWRVLDMSLMKLFNYKYFYQNLKKSASILALFIGIIPILNVIVFLLMASANPGGFLVTLDHLSILLLIGMYFIPVVLAATLYSFMFKRKSIDFIGSMPISKKSIYLTNTIGGSLLLLAMLFLTIFLTAITSILLPHVYVPLALFLDLFLIFAVGYLFIYATVTLAFSLVGNFITGIAVTLLLLFFIPYLRAYKVAIQHNGYARNEAYIDCNSTACIPKTYTCSTYDISCLEHQARDEYAFYLYEKKESNTKLFPVKPIFYLFGIEGNSSIVVFDETELFTTILATLLYFGIGYFIYKRRKFENCETSFSSFSTHLFVKGLTMLPICTVLYEMVQYQSFYVNLFALSLLLIYYFVYDLITRKHIEQVKKNLVAFVITGTLFFLLCSYITSLPKQNYFFFASEDIQKIDLKLYPQNSYTMETYTITKREEIDKILGYLVQEDKEHDYVVPISFFSKGKKYETDIFLTEEQYENLLPSHPAKRENSLAHIKNAYAQTIKRAYVSDIAWYKKAVQQYALGDNIDTNACKLDTQLVFYYYIHHEIKKIQVSSCIQEEIQQNILESTNRSAMDYYEKNANRFSYIDILEEEISQIEDLSFLQNYYSTKIHSFIYEQMKEGVSLEKDLFELDFGYQDGKSIRGYLNNKEAFVAFITSLREEASKTEDYQEYKRMEKESMRGEDIEEYD